MIEDPRQDNDVQRSDAGDRIVQAASEQFGLDGTCLLGGCLTLSWACVASDIDHSARPGLKDVKLQHNPVEDHLEKILGEEEDNAIDPHPQRPKIVVVVSITVNMDVESLDLYTVNRSMGPEATQDGGNAQGDKGRDQQNRTWTMTPKSSRGGPRRKKGQEIRQRYLEIDHGDNLSVRRDGESPVLEQGSAVWRVERGPEDEE